MQCGGDCKRHNIPFKIDRNCPSLFLETFSAFLSIRNNEKGLKTFISEW